MAYIHERLYKLEHSSTSSKRTLVHENVGTRLPHTNPQPSHPFRQNQPSIRDACFPPPASIPPAEASDTPGETPAANIPPSVSQHEVRSDVFLDRELRACPNPGHDRRAQRAAPPQGGLDFAAADPDVEEASAVRSNKNQNVVSRSRCS